VEEFGMPSWGASEGSLQSSPPLTPRYKCAAGATWQMLLMGREP